MWNQHLVDATGIVALTLSVRSLTLKSDRALLKASMWSLAAWAFNSLLIGAHTAAALSLLGAGRQAGASALRRRPVRVKTAVLAGVSLATLLVAALTWSGLATLLPLAGSLIATFAAFRLAGRSLRVAMLTVNLLWLSNAVFLGSGWQAMAASISSAAAAVGAWRAMPAVACDGTCAQSCVATTTDCGFACC